MAALTPALPRAKQIQAPTSKVSGMKVVGTPLPINKQGVKPGAKPVAAAKPLARAPVKAAPKAPPPVNPLTSTFGLNTTSKAAFNPLAAGPTTLGSFNQSVLNAAKPQYLPQLQDIQGQTAAENTANAQRRSAIGSIYNQYQQQAKTAFGQVQKSLNDIIAQNNAGPGQANLGAALQSAQGGPNSLAQMMGITAPEGAAETLPYTGAAQAATTATQDELNNLASSYLAVPSEQLGNVPLERATELNTESLRHQAAAQGLRTQQQALVDQIPGIIEKAREQMVSDLQSSQSLTFQEQLAKQQFGLQSQAQAFNQTQTAKQFAETQKNDAANRAAQAATTAQNAQTIANQQQQISSNAADATAKAQGQAQANAIKYIQSVLTPTKDQLTTKTVKNPVTGITTKQQVIDPTTWHPDLGSALRGMMTLYGLNQDEALKLIAAVGGGTFVSGGGGQTIAQWADTFKQRAAKAATPTSRTATGVGGALKSIGTSIPKIF